MIKNYFSNFNASDHAIIPARACSTPYNFTAELGQRPNLSYSVVKGILNSRRLLIDHVECLENSLFEVELSIPKVELFTLSNLSLLGSVALLLNMSDRVLQPIKCAATSIAGAYGLVFFYKHARKYQNQSVKRRVDSLVRSIENFGNGVKKNVTYFNELAFMKSGADTIEDIHYKRAWGCIQAIKTVTESLFEATRNLESNYRLSAYFNDFYIPMEDLKTCEYFTRQLIEYNPRHIKDFYNIFAYVQSQFLLRLGLIVAENSSINFLRSDITKLVKQIQKILTDEDENFLKISSALKKRHSIDRSKLRMGEFENRNFAPSAILKDTSLKLTSSIIAVAEECEKLDCAMQNIVLDDNDFDETAISSDKRSKLMSMAETMRSIELSLSTCNDDFQRLMIIYNKFVGQSLKSSASISRSDTNDTYEHLQALSLPDVEIDEVHDDDYFAYAFDERAEDDDDIYQKYTDYELYNLDKKVSKKRFQPVLKQLRTKIEPIRDELENKERRILQAKGIDVEKFFGKDYGRGDSPRNQSDSESDSDTSVQHKEKQIRTDNYSELREFLARKAPISLFSLPQPRSSLFEEDILE